MNAFAIYKLPHDRMATLMIQRQKGAVTLVELSTLNGESGFLLSPFMLTTEEPCILIAPDECYTVPFEQLGDADWQQRLEQLEPCLHACGTSQDEDGREAYHKAFSRCYEALCEGRVEKVVLARTSFEPLRRHTPYEMFLQACRDYPRMFVALVSTPVSGTWLMASPELLLENEQQSSNRWHTMALAGTMRLEGEQLQFDNPRQDGVQDIRWSQKNIQEQRLVATYVRQCLQRLDAEVEETGPFTKRAADLVHLCSDFHAVSNGTKAVGEIVASLHPTPAVCGLPKWEARDLLLRSEPASRHFYSGFCGPLNIDSQTKLFVSLRCMEIGSDGYRLYAGGGLLKDSVEEQEWQETEAKMQTMRRLL